MGVIAANRATVCAHRDRLEPHPLVGAQIAYKMTVIAVQRVFFGEVKVISILHQKFAPTHDAKARAYFIPEFPLDLVHGQRQIFVAADMRAENVGDELFGGGREQHVAIVTIGDAQHFGPIGIIATTLAPQIRRLDGWHQHRQVACTQLFFVNDILDLAQHLEAKRQPRINSGTGLFYHASTQHQPMADDLRLAWVFLENGQKIAAQTHACAP